MVKQGDIIKINFNPQVGHEQAGYRPAVIVSNDTFNKVTHLASYKIRQSDCYYGYNFMWTP